MKALTLLLSLLFFLSLLALELSPELWWGVAVAGTLAPIFWIANLILLLFYFWKPSWWAVLPVITLVTGLGLMSRSFALATENNSKENCLQVLSYNVSHFGRPKGYNFVRDSSKLERKSEIKSFINWVVQQEAPIKCFQEFYSFPNNPIFDVDARMQQEGWKHRFISADTLKANKSRFGLAIYSKHPILRQGVVFVGTSRFNRGIWADISIGEDTLRVINLHFQSAQLQRTRQKSKGKKDALTKMFWMFKKSLQERNHQSQQVMEFIAESPYPVLVCGDLNSTPYSHVYQKLSEKLNNSFEAAGNGFGFTFNHPKLFFLRIDNQFVSPELETCGFNTLQQIKYSAHYPLVGYYLFPVKH